MTFEKWFLASPHRAKYDSASPAYLAAREAWKAAKREALLEAAAYAEEQSNDAKSLTNIYAKGCSAEAASIAIWLRQKAKELE